MSLSQAMYIQIQNTLLHHLYGQGCPECLGGLDNKRMPDLPDQIQNDNYNEDNSNDNFFK